MGGRPLMLVHGFTGAKEDFSDFLLRLAERGWHVVAPDLRGHGASDKPDDEGAYALPIFAGDVFALADTLGWSSFTLLGHSMGGMIAQHMLLAAPDRIDARHPHGHRPRTARGPGRPEDHRASDRLRAGQRHRGVEGGAGRAGLHAAQRSRRAGESRASRLRRVRRPQAAGQLAGDGRLGARGSSRRSRTGSSGWPHTRLRRS